MKLTSGSRDYWVLDKQGTLTSTTPGNYTVRTRSKKVIPNLNLENRLYWLLEKTWEPYTGPKGGKGWKRGKEIRYQTEKPSEREGAEEPTSGDVLSAEQASQAIQAIRDQGKNVTVTRTPDGGFKVEATGTSGVKFVENANIPGEARASGGNIHLGPKFKALSREGKVSTIAHEYGHVLTDRDRRLALEAIDEKLWGYGKEGRAESEGIYGLRPPEEQWADAVAAFILTPEEQKEKHPEVHKFVQERLSDDDVKEAKELFERVAPPRELISRDTLQYVVEREGDWVIKTPKPGFGFQPSADVTYAQRLEGIVPETQLVQERGVSVLKQRFVDGREATEDETEEMRKRIREKGVSPRGLLPQDIIVDGDGRKWVIDVGNFEKLKKSLEKAWRAYTGPQGGRGWQSSEDPSDIRYQTEKPSEREEGKKPTPEEVHASPEEALQAASVMEGGATITRTEEGFEVKPRPEMGAPIGVYGDYVEQFRPMFTKTFDDISGEFGEENVRGRLKSPQSLKEKVEVRVPGRRASDILGYMVLADDYEGLEDVRQRVRDRYNVVEEDERFLFDPGAGYYRAVHFLVEAEGTVAEVQVMTRRMQQLKEWGHKYIYKGARGEEEAFRDYAREVGEWVDTMDRGEDAGALPACPPELEEEGLCLPF
ncbi:MAG: RelA/SpoT domain-containing protein [Candidatus Thermoplasmatota archaeon]|nr:RelA/SpoT domain-containing protein [Candidatus Thermoplasmatota archaeon]